MSYTQRIFSLFNTPEFKKRLRRDRKGRSFNNRTGWLKHGINKLPRNLHSFDLGPDPSNGSLQQSDLLRNFYLTIAICGLDYAYNQQNYGPGDMPSPPRASNNADKKVIIVGAGMSGFVSGYELKREGYDIEYLEMSQRYGGRVKTLDHDDGFDRGLFTDGKKGHKEGRSHIDTACGCWHMHSSVHPCMVVREG
jgi:hypothetical protein